VHECFSLLRAGTIRRVGVRVDIFGLLYACLLSLEVALALSFIAASVHLVTSSWSTSVVSVSLVGVPTWVPIFHHHVLRMAGYMAVLGMLAAVFGIAAKRAWHHAATMLSSHAEGPNGSPLSVVERGVLLAQPVVGLLIGVIALLPGGSTRGSGFGSDIPGAALAAAIAGASITSVVALAFHRRRRRSSARQSSSVTRTAAAATAVVALLLAALLAAGVSFGTTPDWWVPAIASPTASASGDLATGFTTTQLVATGVTRPVSVACHDVDHCYVYADQGAPLTAHHFDDAIGYLSGGRWRIEPFALNVSAQPLRVPVIACPGPSTCYAVGLWATHLSPFAGGPFARSSDGGATWQKMAQPMPAAWAGLPVLACPSLATCLVANNSGVTATFDGGASFETELSLPPAKPGVRATELACPTATNCFVVVQQLRSVGATVSGNSWLYSSTDAGRRWTRRVIAPLVRRSDVSARSLPTPLPRFGFACASAADCVLYADNQTQAHVLTTLDAGASWTTHALPGAETQSALVCAAPSTCWAETLSRSGAPQVWRSTDEGTTWIATTPFPLAADLSSDDFSCPTSVNCVFLASVATNDLARRRYVLIVTANGGRTWSVDSFPLLPSADRATPPNVG
jgi:hypothetical protein